MLTHQISKSDLEVANYERIYHLEPLVQKLDFGHYFSTGQQAV